LVEVALEQGFAYADVQAVKAIPGSRWNRRQQAWVLPDTPETRAALTRTFGPRLVGDVGDVGPDPPPGDAERILHRLRVTLRTREYSPKTIRSYVDWCRRFLRHPGVRNRPSSDLTRADATAFLEDLATRDQLSAGSRNQAAAALAFLFREVLGRDEMASVARASGPSRVPVVLTHREVIRLLHELQKHDPKYLLIGVLLYSAGLRIDECLHLRIKDIDFDLRQIIVRDGKGRKDRYVPLARRAVGLLRAQIQRVADRHEDDIAAGHGRAPLPAAMHRKDPNAGYELRWQYLFPASTITRDPATHRTGRRPLHTTAAQRVVKAAVLRAGITKRATCHTLRHSFATEALRGGCDIRTLQHIMGHKDIRTTMIYLHVIEQTGHYIRSPLDRPDDPEDDTVPWGVG
jgi:integron integrase